MRYLLGLIYTYGKKYVAIIENGNSLDIVLDSDLNDAIGHDANCICNVDCKLINELYNRADYGSELTLSNIIRNKNNMSINPELRYGSIIYNFSRLIVNKDTSKNYLIELSDGNKVQIWRLRDLEEFKSASRLEISASGSELINNNVAYNINDILKDFKLTVTEHFTKSVGNKDISFEIGYLSKDNSEDKEVDNSKSDSNLLENEGKQMENSSELESGKNSGFENSEINMENKAVANTGNPKDLSFDLEDDDESDEEEEIQLTYSKYDPECPKCHGKGFHSLNGFKVECDCGRKIFEKEQEIEKLKKAEAEEKIKEATNINVVSLGLVPEEYKDIEYNAKKAVNSMERVANGRTIYGKKRIIAAMNSIISSCKTGKKLKHSYLLGGDAGFGKKSCVYTCIKYLYQRGARPVKYMSLTELGLMRANVVKQAQAVTSAGYYYRERDSDLFQKLINDSVDILVKGIVRRTYDLTKATLDNSGIGSDETEAITNHIFGIKDNRDVRYVNGNHKKAIENINTNHAEIWNRIKDRVLDEIYSKYNLLENEDTRMSDYVCEQVNKQIDTWEDVVNTPILFTYFSGSLNKHFETEVLQMILKERGTKCLPTVVTIDNTIQMFRDDIGYSEDNKNRIYPTELKTRSMYWDNMLSESSSFNIDDMDANKVDEEIKSVIEYDRLIYITAFIKRDNSVKPGVNI